MKKSLTQTLTRFATEELIIILAIVTILGGLIGYSLAASQSTTTIQPTYPMQAVLIPSDEIN